MTFALDTNTWQDDVGSPMRQCLTGGACHHREFLFADGRRTRAESATTEDTPSVQGSMPGLAKLVTDDDITQL